MSNYLSYRQQQDTLFPKEKSKFLRVTTQNEPKCQAFQKIARP